MFYYQQNSQPPPPPTYASLVDQKNENTGHPNASASSQQQQPGQPMGMVYSQPPQPGQPMGTVFGHQSQPGQPMGTVYSQQPQPGQPMGTVYGQQPQPGQPLTVGYAQPQYGQPIPGQPMMIQTQPVLVQNQYGQPMIVQGGVQPVGAVPIPIAVDPHNPNQNAQSVSMKCPHCQTDITTTTQYVVGGCTWLWCILLAFMGCLLCCFLPFFWNGSKDVIHTCPNCKKEVGRFNRQQRSNVRVHAGGHHRRRRRRRR